MKAKWFASAAALVCVAGLARAQTSLVRPSLGGYHLGQKWEEVGAKAMPCETKPWVPGRSIGLPSFGNEWKWCTASDGLQLAFLGGRLVQLFMDSAYEYQEAEALWHTKWKARTVQAFGQPDSVTVEWLHMDPLRIRRVTASWDRPADKWCAEVQVDAIHPTEYANVKLWLRMVEGNPKQCSW